MLPCTPSLAPSSTASFLLSHSTHLPRFSSSCPSLDNLLSPPPTLSTTTGLAHNNILELVGPPGVGKTRTTMGYALSARFEAVGRGEEERDQVLLLDAEGSLSPSLLYDTATLYAQHHGHDPSTIPLVLQGIHYRRLTDLSLLISALYSLPTWLSSHPEVRLLILDSLSSHYRPASLSTSTKTLFLNLLRSTLTLLTTSYNITVIATTFLSIKMFTPQGVPTTFSHDSLALLVPQMGDTWLPSSSNSNGGGGATVECWRVVLYFDERGERMAHLLSTPNKNEETRATTVTFTMDALGPCDHPPA